MSAAGGETASSQRTRPSWDEYFMKIAHEVATRSTCTRRQIGALIVRDKRILATGYNNVPCGIEHCTTRGCLRDQLHIPSGERHELCRGIHAEQNAVVQAARNGITIDNSIVYCTAQPCILCAKILINAGVKEIVFEGGYPDELSREILDEAGVKLRRFDGGQPA
ncbi:MAG: cytidine/deoxycytidylate deaminase family protein [Actinomycetes bacterium]|jgi:dCMP deaminase|nr:cytidine/deoxycytidylate deaminase family protein [Actinomycetes bacterium]